MRNSKTIFIFLIAVSFVVSGLAQEGSKKTKRRGGIIGALEGILKDMEEKEDGGKKVEYHRYELEEEKADELKGEKAEGEEEENQDTTEEEAPAEAPDESKGETDFIQEEGEREESASTTDEEGNTTTVYRTKNGVWIKKVTDKNGNVILEERKIETADGGKKVETIDHKKGTKTQETYDAKGKLVSFYTEDIHGNKRRAKYQGGVIMFSKATDSSGNVTSTTYDHQGRVEHSETKDKSGKVKETADREEVGGSDAVRHVDHERGVTTVTTTAPDGSKIEETSDNKTGETISEVGISADGKLFTYKTGSDADKAFEEAERISMTKYSSTQDFVGGKESEASEFRYRGQAELDEQDRQLKAQMAGGKAVSGDDIIVSRHSKEVTNFARREGQEAEIEQIATSSEVRGVKPDGPYSVKSAGEPVSAEQYGKTPSEALSNALASAASTVITKIRSEFLDRMRSTQKTDGGVVTQQSDEDITSTLDASSFAVFESYEVESIRMEDDHYVVKVRAQPGVTVRK